MKKLIAFQILIALAVGAVIGHFFPDFGMALRPVGDGFIRLIKMIVVPIVFSTIVIGAAGSGSMKKMGSLGIKTIIWFEVITTLVLGLGLLLANVLKPGVGLDLSHLAKKDIHELSGYTDKVVDFKQMVLDIIPTNIIDVMARNDLLAVIFFAILFGVAAALLATANAVGLPAEGVAIIAGVDRVMDMARTGVNVPGHAIACIVVSKWEKAFRQKEWVSANSQTESI
ncbi:cation:dicarboxylase symporter family transporter [Bacillus subtilis]|nr:cation:dicarboxylase symporter family transporter [Bacillus subtilis]